MTTTTGVGAARQTDGRGWGPELATFCALLVVYLVPPVLRFHALETGYDFAYFRQAAWLLGHGEPLHLTMRDLPLLADHQSWLFLPLGLLARGADPAWLLLGAQSAAIAVGGALLVAGARRGFGIDAGPTALLAVLYAVYPPLHLVATADFHPEVLAVPAMVGLPWAVRAAAWRTWYPLAVAVMLAAREDMVLPVLVVGLVVAAGGERRPGLLTVLAGGAVAAFDRAVQVAASSETGFSHWVNYRHFGDGPLDVAVGMLTDPGEVVTRVLTLDALDLALVCWVPLALLPVLAPRSLLPAVPLQLVYLLGANDAAHTLDHHYPLVLAAMSAGAAAPGLAVLLARPLPIRVPTRPVVVIGVSIGLVGAVAGGALTRLGADLDRWIDGPDDVDRARARAVATLPAEVPVTASSRMIGLVPPRRHLYRAPAPWAEYRPEATTAEPDWAVVDLRDPWLAEGSLERFVIGLEARGFLRIVDDDAVLVLCRPPGAGSSCAFSGVAAAMP